MQALRRFENMSSIRINGAAPIADLVMLAVGLEQDAGAWRVSCDQYFNLAIDVVKEAPVNWKLLMLCGLILGDKILQKIGVCACNSIPF